MYGWLVSVVIQRCSACLSRPRPYSSFLYVTRSKGAFARTPFTRGPSRKAGIRSRRRHARGNPFSDCVANDAGVGGSRGNSARAGDHCLSAEFWQAFEKLVEYWFRVVGKYRREKLNDIKKWSGRSWRSCRFSKLKELWNHFKNISKKIKDLLQLFYECILATDEW